MLAGSISPWNDYVHAKNVYNIGKPLGKSVQFLFNLILDIMGFTSS